MHVKLDDIMSHEDRLPIDHARRLTLLPDPEPRDVWCPVISVDDHVLEPATLFDRVPHKYTDSIPRMVEVQGRPAWQLGDRVHYLSGTDSTVGRPTAEWNVTGMRWEDYRPGTYDVDARIRDMDLNGVWASLNFPSNVWGFAGTTLSKLADRGAAFACVQAYNDWVLEWCAASRERFIPCQLPFLADAELAAGEIRRNADRGITAVSFSENPYELGFPTLHSGYWDPFLAACAETETVVNLHLGSSGSIPRPEPDSPPMVLSALFPVNGIMAVVDWIFSRIPVRYPTIKLVLSEAGVSWVPTVIERLRRSFSRRELSPDWSASDPHPIDLLYQNFWFTSIEDPSAFRVLDLIGEDRVMVETDYPHADSSWPDSQELFRQEFAFLTVPTIKKLCFENAAHLYRHPLPPDEMLAASTLFRDGARSTRHAASSSPSGAVG
jgi:predicted TIM-barrel fold metal-dependent hydrolase